MGKLHLTEERYRCHGLSLFISIMAGEIRQKIDIPSLERYLNEKVPEIKTPLDVKQVGLLFRFPHCSLESRCMKDSY